VAETALLVPVGDRGAFVTGVGPDGATVVAAYTSPAPLAGAKAVTLPFAQLAAEWPDPRWTLAIGPGTPVAAYVAGADLPAVLASVFAPANASEEALAAARGDDAVAVLRAADLHLPLAPGGSPSRDLGDPEFPWWRVTGGGETVVPAFTSERRMRGWLGAEHPDADFVVVELALLARAWPDAQWALAVNPGTPLAVAVAGATVRRLG
jgi:SseB protein N-terminal domain